MSGSRDLLQCGPINGFLSDRLAEVEGLRRNRVDSQEQVMSGDGASNVVRQRFNLQERVNPVSTRNRRSLLWTYTFNGLFGGCVLQNNLELGEISREFAQVGQEVLLSVQHRNVLDHDGEKESATEVHSMI